MYLPSSSFALMPRRAPTEQSEGERLGCPGVIVEFLGQVGAGPAYQVQEERIKVVSRETGGRFAHRTQLQF